MKKALIFDPYLDTLGGGERYCLTFATALISLGYSVELAWNSPETLKAAENRFGLDLSKIKVNKKAYEMCTGKSSFFKKIIFTMRFGLIFWISDGSLPFLFSKNNLIHLQVPFKTLGGNSFVNKIKTLFVHKFVYNSRFTANVHETHLPKNKSFILYPPIDVESFHPEKKEDIILSVARFDSPSHSKRQDILIDAFKILNKSYPDYQLFLAGGSFGTSDTLEKLKAQAGSLPVKFLVNPDFEKLKNLYAKSKFFWHAAGYEIDDKQHPEKVEHFGMTTVESMSAGCIPVVMARGGQKEIISDGNGVLFETIQDLAKQTEKLIKNSVLAESYSKSAIKTSEKYSTKHFIEKISSLL